MQTLKGLFLTAFFFLRNKIFPFDENQDKPKQHIFDHIYMHESGEYACTHRATVCKRIAKQKGKKYLHGVVIECAKGNKLTRIQWTVDGIASGGGARLDRSCHDIFWWWCLQTRVASKPSVIQILFYIISYDRFSTFSPQHAPIVFFFGGTSRAQNLWCVVESGVTTLPYLPPLLYDFIALYLLCYTEHNTKFRGTLRTCFFGK